MNKLHVLSLVLVLVVSMGCSQEASVLSNSQVPSSQPENNLIWLKSKKVKVGILPQVGGRIVYFSELGKTNVLLSNPKQWSQESYPVATPTTPFEAYQGHIVWVGPQTGWWKFHQLETEFKGKWPPDPFLIYGRFKVVKQTESEIEMEGPPSPVTGVKLTKMVRLEEDGSVLFRVIAENIRKENVSWDLWTNTRFPFEAKVYAWVSSEKEIRIESFEKPGRTVLPSEKEDHFFSFYNQQSDTQQVAKAYIHSERPFLAAFVKDQVFVKTTQAIDKSKIHPEQAIIEIYQSIPPENSQKKGLLELEFHGAYQTLTPGEKMVFEEKWNLYSYSGGEKTSEQRAFLKALMQ